MYRAEAERTTLAEARSWHEKEIRPRKKATTAACERDRVRSLASIRGKDVAIEVAAITGHKTLQVLKRYTHLRAEDLVGRLG